MVQDKKIEFCSEKNLDFVQTTADARNPLLVEYSRCVGFHL